MFSINLSFTLPSSKKEIKLIARSLIHTTLKGKKLKYDWTDALLNLSVIKTHDNIQYKASDYDKVVNFYLKSESSKEVKVTSPDLFVSLWGAIELKKKGFSFNNLEEKSWNYIVNEPINSIQSFNHIGHYHRFKKWLPKTRHFTKKSIWVDSLVMYVIPGMMLATQRKDGKFTNFFKQQHNVFHEYLSDGLYRHAYYLKSKNTFPKGEYAWLRGNSWVLLSLVEMYEMETDEKQKKLYQEYFNDLSSHLAPYQKSNGLFNTLLTKRKIKNYEDSAGNAIIAYSLLKAERIKMIKKHKINLEKLVSSLINDKIVTKSNKTYLKDISGPTNAFKHYWYYTYLVGKRRNLGYGVGPMVLALNELLLKEQ